MPAKTASHLCPVCRNPTHRMNTSCKPCQAEAEKRRRANPIGADLRDWLMRRFSNTCASYWCDTTTGLVIDHIVPIKYGGRTDPDNLQVLCTPCNVQKSTSLELAGVYKLLSRSWAGRPLEVHPWLMQETGSFLGSVIASVVLQHPGAFNWGVEIDMYAFCNQWHIDIREVIDVVEDLRRWRFFEEVQWTDGHYEVTIKINSYWMRNGHMPPEILPPLHRSDGKSDLELDPDDFDDEESEVVNAF